MLRLSVASFVFAIGLLPGSTARAGPLLDWLGRPYDPPPSYSPLRYWAPGVARVGDCIHGPRLNVYAPDRHPEIPPTTVILEYAHPAVPPGATLIEPPKPPATSKFRY